MKSSRKVLIVHNFHRTGSASGDDQVYKNETASLAEHGVQVKTYTISNDDFDKKTILGKMRDACGMVWSWRHYYAIRKIIELEKPDIMHIHTFFPLLSPSVLYAAKRSGVPVVATLHDMRFVCPCATCLRGEEICSLCKDGHYFRMCKYGCYKGSRLQSFLVAVVFKYHRIMKSFYKTIDQYICLNDKQIELLSQTGFDSHKIVKKYNFVNDPMSKALSNNKEEYRLPDRYVVFYGRIGEEKGIRQLMRIWDLLDVPLVVMGRGPLEDEFTLWARTKSNVFYLGYVENQKCLEIVRNSEFVVFPSIWYEGCSMIEIETQALSKCLIASDLGFSHEAIKNGYNGYKVKVGDIDLFRKEILRLWENPKEASDMGKNARIEYEKKYLEEDNYVQLQAIYSNVSRNI